MRLYAFLAQTLESKLPTASTTRPASLQVQTNIRHAQDVDGSTSPAHVFPLLITLTAPQAWIDTYAAPGFEEAAAKVEVLLDRHANDEKAEAAGPLRELYGRAMELEYDFFAEHWQGGGEWRGIDPGASSVGIYINTRVGCRLWFALTHRVRVHFGVSNPLLRAASDGLRQHLLPRGHHARAG